MTDSKLFVRLPGSDAPAELDPTTPWTLLQDAIAGPTLRPGRGHEAQAYGEFLHLGSWTFRPTSDRERVLLDGQLADRLFTDLRGTVTVALAGAAAPASLTAHLATSQPDNSGPPAEPQTVTFGRLGTGADVEIDDSTVFPNHAIATRAPSGDRWRLRPVAGPILLEAGGKSKGIAILGPRGQFVLGQTVLTVPTTARPAPNDWLPPSGGAELQVNEVHVERGGRALLERTSFSVRQGQFAVVLGPSGAGKTTLLRVILGEMAIDHGRVTVDGMTVAAPAHPSRPASVIRYVPQETALHDHLSVERTLGYAVALRAASDRSLADRNQDVIDLASKAGISHRLSAPVYELSSGEQKRLSLAVELSVKPNLLILDEPGAGLDAGRDRQLMELLQRLSQMGTTVVCVTHNIDNIECADHLVVLGRGGTVKFAGHPKDALTPPDTWPGAMTALAEGSEYKSPPRRHHTSYTQRPDRLDRPWRTWRLLSRRQTELILTRGSPHARLTGSPKAIRIGRALQAQLVTAVLPILGALLAIMSAEAGWRRGPDAGQLLALLTTVAALTGASLTYSDLVSERRAIKREYRIGVSGLQVVTAKLTVAGAQSAVLTLIIIAVYAVRRPFGGPGALDWPPPILAAAVPLFLVMLASAAAGLLLSAVSEHLQRAVTLITALAILQVALNNVLFNLPHALLWPTLVVPTRLGVAAQAAYLGLQHTPHDPLWNHTFTAWLLNVVALIGLMALFTWCAGLMLDRRCRRMD